MKVEELIELIRAGENEKVEFKEKPSNLGEEICALANSEGGWVIIGIKDNGKIVGCEERKVLKILDGIAQNLTPPPKIKVERLRIDGKTIVVVRVERSERLISLGNIAYIRVGTSKRPLSIQEIFWKGMESGELRWDSQASGIRFEDAEEKYLELYFERLEKLRKRMIKKEDRVKYLLSIKAIKKVNGKLYLTNAGVLFFLKKPQEIFSNAGARIIIMNEEGEGIKQIEFSGPIWKMADELTGWFEKNMEVIEVVGIAKREKVQVYPIRAIREAIINALIHRNYGLEGDVRIFVYKDKIRIRNPGSLMPGVSLDFPEHIPRNPALCNLMFDFGYIEKYGYGIALMKRLTKEHPIADLKFVVREFFFEVIFSKEKLYGILDETDRKIIAYLETPKSSGELSKEIGLSRQALVLRLNKLVNLGLVRKIGKGPKTEYARL